MNKYILAILKFFNRFFQTHQKEIEHLMLKVVEAIVDDVINNKTKSKV